MSEFITKIRNFLITPLTKSFDAPTQFYFFLGMTLATTYSFMALQQAFAGNYVVEEDEREFVFWMQQFLDPELFTNDLITEYFKSITPLGYKALFWMMAKLAINPVLVSKLLLLIIPLIGSIYIFFICLEILPIPIAGCMAIIMFNQNVWMNSVLSSTPRGFVYLFLPAFIYYVLRQSLLGCLIVILLQGVFYPPYIFIFAGILLIRLIHWQQGKITISTEKKELLLSGLGLGLALLIMLPYAFSTSEFGPTVTLTEARLMPEFAQTGRSPFFDDNDLINFYFMGWQSGMFAAGPFKPPRLIWFAFLLPILLRFNGQFPLAKQVNRSVFILLQIILVSLAMFAVAHHFFLRLYFPNRYVMHTLRIVLVIAAAIAITVFLDTILAWAIKTTSNYLSWQSLVVLATSVFIIVSLIFLPVYLNMRDFGFPRTPYLQAHERELYDFLGKQPKDTVTASLTSEVDNLPTFAKRPILIGFEYANPYHLGYYKQIEKRAKALIYTQYSPQLEDLKRFIEQYRVDYFLIDQQAFKPTYVDRNRWFRQWPDLAATVRTSLEQGKIPAIAKLLERCTVLKTTNSLSLVQANCITRLSTIDSSNPAIN
jgi:hypothetical protein